MLLTISTTHQPPTDLGFLLHKNPARPDGRLAFGPAHVFYPEAADERCTAALLLEVDPVALVRRGRGRSDFALSRIRQRPALRRFVVPERRDRQGVRHGDVRPEHGRPELADTRAAARGPDPGRAVPRRRGAPAAAVRAAGLRGRRDAASRSTTTFPDGATAATSTVDARGDTARLRDLLAHLYVLLPVLDDDKHYWVGDDEVEKLLRRGGEWLRRAPRARADRAPLPPAPSGA